MAKVSIFSPYAQFSKETGVLALLANYLHAQGTPVHALRCNGVVSACSRDRKYNWNRPLEACQGCMAEQMEYAQWSRAELIDLSPYITSDIIEQSKQIRYRLSFAEVVDLRIDGATVAHWIKDSFFDRFGVVDPIMSNRDHESFIRRMSVGAWLMYNATLSYFMQAPSTLVYAETKSVLSVACNHAAIKLKLPYVSASWNPLSASVQFRNAQGQVLVTDLVVSRLPHLRADVQSWPSQMLHVLETLTEFIGIDTDSPQSAAG